MQHLETEHTNFYIALLELEERLKSSSKSAVISGWPIARNFVLGLHISLSCMFVVIMVSGYGDAMCLVRVSLCHCVCMRPQCREQLRVLHYNVLQCA